MRFNFTFKCQGCGECCKEEGSVYFTKGDVKRAARVLKMKPDDFITRYLTPARDGKRYIVRVTSKMPCVFLRDHKCLIHSGKPKQCRTFPYWDEYVNDKGELVNFNRPCKGITMKPSFKLTSLYRT